MQSIEITIRETLPSGKQRMATRWMHLSPKGWTSADNLGRESRMHDCEENARRAIAGWLRAQSVLLLAAPPPVEAKPAPAASAAGLEDLL